MHGERVGDGDALLLAAGQVGRVGVRMREHADIGQGIMHALGDVGLWDAEVFRAKGHIVGHDARHHLILGMLKHAAHALPDGQRVGGVCGVETVDDRLPRDGGDKRVDDLDKG